MGELGQMYGGLTGKSKKDFGEGVPFVTYVQVYENEALPEKGYGYVMVGEGEHQNRIARGDVLVTISSENLEDVGMTCVVANEPSEPIYLNSFCAGWRPHDPTLFHPAFLKHLLRCDTSRKQIRRAANGVTRYNISKPKLMRTELPIPPIDYQIEVAKKLDSLMDALSEIASALGAERAMHAQSLKVIRDQLLSFPEKAA